MKAFASAVFLLGIGVAACGAGTAGKAVRPSDPTANDALGKNASCKGLSDEPQLLTLDWDDTLRIDLETGMKKGVVAVKYDCDGFKVLRDCDVPGSYEYAGFSPAKTTAKIEDQDQLEANLPVGAAKMSGEIKRGSTIDIVYVAVGQQSTTVHDVPATKLSGKCEGATHTVRSANIGAFAVTTGTKGQVNAAVEVLSRGASGSSSSSRSLERTNGELSACDSASDSSSEPTAKCKALVQLLLSPINGKAAASTDEPADPKDKTKGITADPIKEGCPTGFVADKTGLCMKKDGAAAPLCAVDNFDDCKAECDKGNGLSCYNAGANRMTAKYNPNANTPPHGGLIESFGYFDKACKLNIPGGCGHQGMLIVLGYGAAKDQAKGDALLTKACSAGDAWSCRFQAVWYDLGINGYKRDQARAFTLQKRACAFGDQHACLMAARALTDGVGTTKDLDAAVKLLAKACDAGDQAVCDRANQMKGTLASKPGSGETVKNAARTKFGMDPIDNPCAQGLRVGTDGTCVKLDAGAKFVCDPSAFDECKRLCDSGDGKSCFNAAANREGKWNAASTKQAEEAYPFLEKSCSAGYAVGCGEMGNALQLGKGVTADLPKAASTYDKACTAGDQPSCKYLATTYLCATATCNGVKKNATKGIAYYKKGCDLGDVSACNEGGDALTNGTSGAKKSPKQAATMFDKACKLGDSSACDKAKPAAKGKH